jgi:hypothetical protein
MAQILNSPDAEELLEPEPANATMTLISNREEIICVDPVYHARTGSASLANFGMSCIVAMPRSDLRFGEICYIELSSGRKPVVVASQKDGSIRISGAYVDSVARELKLTGTRPSNEMSGRSEAWAAAVDGGWQIHREAPTQAEGSKPGPGWNGYVVAPAT